MRKSFILVLLLVVATIFIVKSGYLKFFAKSDLKNIKNYTFIKEVDGDLEGSKVYLWEHTKTGATVIYFYNKGETNNSFSIDFKIIPDDDSGKFHVLEHSVLYGSKKYPISVLSSATKSYIISDLNADTSSTLNRFFASSYHYKSFIELSNIYMDAVFNPLIKEKPQIFYQQGIRRFFDDKNQLANIGVVYNEMFARQVIDMYLVNLNKELYQSEGRLYNSGGNPEKMDDILTYQGLIDAYDKFYTPSNGLFEFYGDIDIVERLNYLDENYLSKYEKTPSYELSRSKLEAKPEGQDPRIVTVNVPAGESLTPQKDSTVMVGYVMDDLSYKEQSALDLIFQSIFRNDSNPYKQAFLSSSFFKSISYSQLGYGKSFVSIFDADSETNYKDASKIYKFIQSQFEKIVTKGLDEESIRSTIQSNLVAELDISTSELGIKRYFPRFQRGWSEHSDPFRYFDVIGILKELSNTDISYFNELLKKYVLSNQRQLIFAFVPDKNFLKDQAKRMKDSLLKKQAALSQADRKKIEDINDSIAKMMEEKSDIYEYAKPLDEKDLETIGSSFEKLAKKTSMDLELKDGSNSKKLDLLTYDTQFDRISEVSLRYGLAHLDTKEFLDLNLFDDLIGLLSKKEMNVEVWKKQIDNNGKFASGLDGYTTKDFAHIPYFYVKVKALDIDKLKTELDLALKSIYETLFQYDNKTVISNYLKAKIQEMKSQLNLIRARFGQTDKPFIKSFSYFSPLAYIYNSILDKASVVEIEKIIESLNTQAGFSSFSQRMNNIFNKVFVFNLPTITIASHENSESIVNILKSSILTEYLDKDSRSHLDPYTKVDKNEGGKNLAFRVSESSSRISMVMDLKDKMNYFNKDQYELINSYLSSKYLDDQVRNKESIAYGAGMYVTDGLISLESWNNTNVSKTNEIFRALPSYMKDQATQISSRDNFLVKLQYIANTERYMTPKEYAKKAFIRTLSGVNEEDLKKAKEQTFSLDLSTILLDKAQEFEQALSSSFLTVFGGDEVINKDRSLFSKVENSLD